MLETTPQKDSVYLNEVLKYSIQGVVIIHLDGTLYKLNDAALKLLRIKEFTPERFWNVFVDDYFGFSMREALLFGISHRIYKTFFQEKELEITTSFAYEGPKQTHALLLFLRDITEMQKLQQAVSRGDRMKELGEMAAMLSHELRNPLGGIRGFASLLFRDLAGQQHLQEMASHVIEGTKTLEKWVTTVLHYAKPVSIVPQTADVGNFLRELAKFLKVDPAFPSNVRLSMHIPNELILAPIDPERLRAALLNLIFNAFTAMPQGGTLTISLLKLARNCQIAVSDTGIGMDEEMLKSLFSLYFTTKAQGNGIGLAETKKIISAHYGTIEVRSQKARGTTFTITIPLERSYTNYHK